MLLQQDKVSDRAPPDESLIIFHVGHWSAARWIALADDEIIRRAIAFTTGRCLNWRVLPRLPHKALAACRQLGVSGLLSHRRRDNAGRNADDAIRFAGHFNSAGSMETALRTGKAAADRLIHRAARDNCTIGPTLG